MEKFTLDEQFDSLYEDLLEASIKHELQELLENDSTYYLNTLNLLEEYIVLNEWQPGDEDGEAMPIPAGQNKGKYDDIDKYDELQAKIIAKYEADQKKAYERAHIDAKREVGIDLEKQKQMYAAQPQYEITQKITEMKFPQNVIFFLKSLFTWIKNHVLNFIDKITNILRSLIGLGAGKSRFTKEDLRFKLEKVQRIESEYLVNKDNAYKVSRSFSDILNGTPGQILPAVNPVSLIPIDAKEVKVFGKLFEGLELDGAQTLNELEDRKEREVMYIRIDTTKDLFELQQTLQHFFDLFDNAYGSNEENLFSVEDLAIMLNVFKDTLQRIRNPKTATAVELSGNLVFDYDAISSAKLKDNLLRTKINTDNLKRAYQMTNQQVNTIAKIIMNKNLLGVSQLGVQYAALSASSYTVMIEILDIIDKRLKEAAVMEKKLQKMKKEYEELSQAIDRQRIILMSISGMTFTSILQRKINDLFMSAQYMTQTIQLRLNCLALYMSELNDTRAILKNLNAINEVNKREKKEGIFSKIFGK